MTDTFTYMFQIVHFTPKGVSEVTFGTMDMPCALRGNPEKFDGFLAAHLSSHVPHMAVHSVESFYRDMALIKDKKGVSLGVIAEKGSVMNIDMIEAVMPV